MEILKEPNNKKKIISLFLFNEFFFFLQRFISVKRKKIGKKFFLLCVLYRKENLAKEKKEIDAHHVEIKYDNPKYYVN